MLKAQNLTLYAILLVLITGISVWVSAQEPSMEGNISDEVIAAHDFGIHLFNTLDTEGVEEYVSEDWVLHDPSNAGHAGTDGFIAWASGFHALMPDFEVIHLDPLIGSDEYLTYRWEFTGTHTGAVPDITPTENEIYMSGIVMHRIVGGKFTETWLSFDNMTLLTQLGVLPSAEAED